MYNESARELSAKLGSIPVSLSPLDRAKQMKKELTQSLDELERLINLLEKNPEIEELLKLSRRFL